MKKEGGEKGRGESSLLHSSTPLYYHHYFHRYKNIRGRKKWREKGRGGIKEPKSLNFLTTHEREQRAPPAKKNGEREKRGGKRRKEKRLSSTNSHYIIFLLPSHAIRIFARYGRRKIRGKKRKRKKAPGKRASTSSASDAGPTHRERGGGQLTPFFVPLFLSPR